ncbi:MAG: sigma-70 family RNA polymerase sigma factor [Myxococcales bacterium FL481]|nr:MAG: sigma-70 family RNA polymerase sigma factor [Myxococcales bacterium FL481]
MTHSGADDKLSSPAVDSSVPRAQLGSSPLADGGEEDEAVVDATAVARVQTAAPPQPATAPGDDEADATETALAEAEPATDEELDAISSALAPAAPAGSTALALRDPLAAYMAEARKYPLLSREEERELAVRWIETGDPQAGRRLVTSNLRLVVKIANEYRRGYHSLLDLVQEGNLGLLKAVQKFDPYRDVKLSTYSGWWIRAYILKFILNNWRLVKIGTTQNQRKLFYNLRKQSDALKAAGVDPSPEALAQALDVSPEEVVEMQKRMSSPDSSLNAPVRGDEDGTRTRMDLLEDADPGPAGHVESDEFKHMLADRLQTFGATLSGRELEIFRDRLVADDPITLQELGDRWGVSRERARQLEKRMILRLREFLQQELGDAVQIALGHE